MPVDEIWEARRKKLEKEMTRAVVNMMEHVRAPALMAKINWPRDADPIVDDLFFAAGDLETIQAMAAAALAPDQANDND